MANNDNVKGAKEYHLTKKNLGGFISLGSFSISSDYFKV